MALYAVVLHSNTGDSTGMTIGIAMVVYVLTIYLYTMIARLAFNGRTWLLVGSGALGIITAVIASGASGTWLIVTGWLVMLLAGFVSGRLTRRGLEPSRVYVAGALVVAVLTLIQYWPIVPELTATAQENFRQILEDAREGWKSMGMTESMIQQNVETGTVLTGALVRLLPGFTILGTLAQFSIGYLIYAGWINRHAKAHTAAQHFVMWRVPFYVAAPLVLFIVLRLLGGDALTRFADNALVILSVYYAVCGLALMEFYMRRLQVSCLLKGGIYLLLFISQIIGYFAAVVLGFVDSYKDWRASALAADASA